MAPNTDYATSDFIISYEQGYNNWYVSEFYKYFHTQLENKLKITFKYEAISEFAKRFNCILNNNSDTLFNWFNLIIYNIKTQKFFIHSWYDYANATIEWCVSQGFDVAKFSAVSNITQDLINKYSFVCPSVYYLENWSNHNDILLSKNNNKTNKKIYFAGMDHGIRENILNILKQNIYFEIYTKSKNFKQKQEYYNDLSKCFYGLSLNGAANICYRDLELFSLGVLNIRSELDCLTYNPLFKDVHYIEFMNSKLVTKILNKENIDLDILLLIDKINNDIIYKTITDNAYDWYEKNCLPYNQFKIISSFLEELTVLD